MKTSLFFIVASSMSLSELMNSLLPIELPNYKKDCVSDHHHDRLLTKVFHEEKKNINKLNKSASRYCILRLDDWFSGEVCSSF